MNSNTRVLEPAIAPGLMQTRNQQSFSLLLPAGLPQLHRNWFLLHSWKRQVPLDLRTDPPCVLGFLLEARSCLL